MEAILLLAVLIAFWVFIRYDQSQFKNSKPLSREQMREGFVPGGSFAWKRHAGVALLALIGSAHQFLSPSLPPFTGKWSLINTAIYASLGKYGLAIIWALGAFAFAAIAYSKYRAVAAKQ